MNQRKVFNCSIICVHAPAEDKNGQEKDAFYDDLDNNYEECPGRDVKIIIGDLNAKIGRAKSIGQQLENIVGILSPATMGSD
jgi:hypothetical protein